MAAISIGDLEAAAAGGWRAPEQAALGSWLLRAADGFTGRANSALAIGDPGLPLAAAIGEVRRWYRARGLPAMVAVPFPLGRPESNEVDRFLARQGWAIRSGAATVMTAAPAAVAVACRAAAGPTGVGVDIGVDVETEPDDAWLALYHYRGQDPPPIAGRLLMSAPWQAFCRVHRGGQALAIDRVAAAGDWAGLTAVEVHPGHRRRGLGRAITAALADLAAGRGVAGLYLQVEDSNAPARAMYGAAGFADHHGYHYRVEPPRAAGSGSAGSGSAGSGSAGSGSAGSGSAGATGGPCSR